MIAEWGMLPLQNPQQIEAPFKVTLSFTHTCNLDCRLCYADCRRQGGRAELDTSDWQRFIDQCAADGVIALLVEGGEPLHRSDALAVLGHATPLMLTRLRTNGTLVTAQRANEIAAMGVAAVLVDVWGARAATHDFLTGTPGAFERAIAGVRHLLAAGVETQMLLILNRHNIDELQDYLTLAESLGVTTVGILRPYPIGRARREWKDLAVPLVEMTAALAALRPPEGMRVMQSWHPNDGNCCWQMAAVNAHGDSIGCTYLREFVNYGNVRATSLRSTWDHPLYRELRAGHVERSCASCAHTQGSHGGCRSTAYAFSGRWSAADPFDAGLNEGIDLRELPDWMLQEKPRP